MTSRQRIGVGSGGGAGGGGGPAPTGNVLWGPDFGNPPEITMGASVSMPTVVIVNNKVIGVNVSMPTLSLVNNKGIGATVAMPTVALVNDDHLGAQITMPAVALVNDKQIGVNVTMPTISLANTEGISAHLSGSVLGAPFLQSVASNATTASASSITISKPTGTVSGDLLVALVGHSALSGTPPVMQTPSGWNFARWQQSGGAGAGTGLGFWWKTAGGSEPASYTFQVDPSSGTPSLIGTIFRITATHATTPVDTHAGQGGNATDPVAPSITTTAANCLKICGCLQINSLAASYTPPAGYVEQSDLTATNLGVVTCTGETATRVQAATGASGTATMDSSQAVASNYAAIHLAIAPGALEIAS